jgi:3-hydroxybutyryl-CoA dehydrogenase
VGIPFARFNVAIAGFRSVGVVGAGQMGCGIAQVCATYGLSVVLADTNAGQLDKGLGGINKSLAKLAEKGVITAAQQQSAVANITTTQSLASVGKVDLVIEAILENEQAKVDVFRQLEGVVGADTVFASNTSSIPITRMAAATKRPDRFIGMHFMNPVPLMKLVEIIPGMATSPNTTTRITDLAVALGKETSLSQDYPGFVVNRTYGRCRLGGRY